MKNLFSDPFLYLVTDSLVCDEKRFFTIVLEAVQGGVNIVQLREKGLTFSLFIKKAEKLKKLLEPFKVPLIINDNIDVAKEVGASGVHLGQSDKTVAEAREILGNDAIIGLSVENLDEGREAQNEKVDYIAASPVFETKSKSDVKDPFQLTKLKMLCEFSKHPVVAIGGIDLTNAYEVIQAGARGIAVISAIFQAQKPAELAMQIKTYMRGKSV